MLNYQRVLVVKWFPHEAEWIRKGENWDLKRSFLQALSASCQLQVLSAHVTEIPWVRKSGTPRNPRISAGKVSAGHSSSTTCCATNRNGPQFGSWPFCHAGTASPLERIELQPTMLQKKQATRFEVQPTRWSYPYQHPHLFPSSAPHVLHLRHPALPAVVGKFWLWMKPHLFHWKA